MKKLILYIASSLNGKIARLDGSVEWLENIPNPEKTDHGYFEFYKSIDTTLQGYNTYKQILDWGIDFPYKGTKNFVLTSKQDLSPTKDIEFINHDHIEFVKNLKSQQGKDIWLIGGGKTNTILFNAGLIDEIKLYIMPIVIPEGISIFESIPVEKHLKLLASKTYSTGAVELHYQL
ncbi:MAG: dihydrofolate reductase family protein [Cyclobacteriaceae bacterium]|nr:dihydrofolate reductase family protein [Cyclobacteriaceae bacterium]